MTQKLPDDAKAVIVALGTNDKGQFASSPAVLEEALMRLEGAGVRILARSSWWTSKAWPDPADPDFTNAVVEVETDQGPNALMATLSRIEDELGRVRTVRNAPRTLDLDLIAYGRIAGDLDGLILPHPRAVDRLFVMGPIAEIMPSWRHPVDGRTALELAALTTVGTDAKPLR